jgi:hypothetical protein
MIPEQETPNTTADKGRAVDDEDPNNSPFEDGQQKKSPITPGTMPTGPAQPFDVEHVESDRAKSQGPRLDE